MPDPIAVILARVPRRRDKYSILQMTSEQMYNNRYTTF